MIKIFTLVLELLEIPFSQAYLDLAQYIEKNPQISLISFSAYGYLFFAFQNFLLGKISQEEFVALGDSFGNLYENQSCPIYDKEVLAYGLVNDSKAYSKSCIIFPKEDKVFLEKLVPTLDVVLQKIESQIFYL